MVEKDVIDAVAAERIKKSADESKAFVFDKTGKIEIGRKSGGTEFQNEKWRHEIGDSFRRKGKRQPEERTEQQIKRVGADEIRAEVGRRAPENVALADGVVRHLIERDLLDVKIPVIDEIFKDKIDIFITFKAICEFVTKQQFESQNAYKQIANTFLPKIDKDGILLLEDVTFYSDVTLDWLPKMMDKNWQIQIMEHYPTVQQIKPNVINK